MKIFLVEGNYNKAKGYTHNYMIYNPDPSEKKQEKLMHVHVCCIQPKYLYMSNSSVTLSIRIPYNIPEASSLSKP